MPVMSYISGAMYAGRNEYWWGDIFNTSYQSVIGNDIAFVFGGGQITNVYGYTLNVQIDWEYFFYNNAKKLFPGILELFGSALFGSVGNTSIIYGDNVQLNYYGKSLTVSRFSSPAIEICPPKKYTIAEKKAFDVLTSLTPIEAEVEAAKLIVNEDMQEQIKKLVFQGFDPFSLVIVPYPIKVCLIIGIVLLFSVAMVARFLCDVGSAFNSSASTSEQQSQLALWSGVISQCECTWIYAQTILEMWTTVPILTLNGLVRQATADLSAEEGKTANLLMNIAELEAQAKSTVVMEAGKKAIVIITLGEKKDELLVSKSQIIALGKALKTAQENFMISRQGYALKPS